MSVYYDKEKKCFKYPEEYCDNYVAQYLKDHSLFNETQLMVIIEAIIPRCEEVMMYYGNCLGDLLIWLNNVKNSTNYKNNEIKEKEANTKFIDYRWRLIEYKMENPVFRLISSKAIELYPIYRGNIQVLRLDKLQSKGISSKQIYEIQDIIRKELDAAITSIKDSHIFKLAKQEGTVYFDPKFFTEKEKEFVEEHNITPEKPSIPIILPQDSEISSGSVEPEITSQGWAKKVGSRKGDSPFRNGAEKRTRSPDEGLLKEEGSSPMPKRKHSGERCLSS